MAHTIHPHALQVSPSGEYDVVMRAPLRERLSWAVYDFANTIFAMNVATLYFAVWLVVDLGASNTAVAVGNGVSSLLVALSIPLFGAISDVRRRRKPWVVSFTLAACVATIAIGVVGHTMVPLFGDSVVGGGPRPEGWHITGAPLLWILVAFIAANYFYQGALPFYNAMMPELVPPHEYGRLSGLGVAVGYCGSIVGVILVSPFFDGTLPGLGALPDGVRSTLTSVIPFTEHGGRVSVFVPTALLFLLFALPLFFFCRDHAPAVAKRAVPWREAFREIGRTLRDARRYPGVLRFIFASFLYQDAMGTIISYMAVYAVVAMGFEQGAERTLFLVLTVPAIFGSYLCGRLVDRIGPKRTLAVVLLAWIGLLLAMIVAPTRAAFWAVGLLIGLIFGGVNTAERPLLLSLVPDVEAARFFGLMVLSARAAAILGPFVWGFTVDGLTPSIGTGAAYRAAVGMVAVAMTGALLLLWHVPDQFRRPHR